MCVCGGEGREGGRSICSPSSDAQLGPDQAAAEVARLVSAKLPNLHYAASTVLTHYNNYCIVFEGLSHSVVAGLVSE